ncbi:Uncharacterized protein TCM_012113 [Theobroma cacao]|uniref:Uncharacterized protein n=1 Tax=Theobroma cacao TaxID=3641 RepID=A0A061FTQ1_THECC|nr:Uncharacterized protein TCM_012113 [Theobroma cacao]
MLGTLWPKCANCLCPQQAPQDAPQIPVIDGSERWRIMSVVRDIKQHSLNEDNLYLANAEICWSGHRVLHFAVFEGQLKMIDKFLSRMSTKDLKMQDTYGRTALHHAAMSSKNTKIAQSLIRKNRELLMQVRCCFGSAQSSSTINIR